MKLFKPNNVIAIVAAFFVISTTTNCSHNETFTIEGTIENGKGSMLYLSNIGITGNAILDSVKLKSNGTFKFSLERPECYDFYRLQLNKKGRQITIAIDSTETVTIETDANAFADSCKISGSEESIKIMKLIELETALQSQVDMLIKDSSPAIGETRNTIFSLIHEFKQNICKEYIASAPGTPSAYYALFLQLNNAPLFDPMRNRFDSRCFSAVATSLNNKYPHSTRAMHLYNIAIKGIRATKPVKTDTIYIEPTNVNSTGVFDIKLPDIDGDSISLSSLKGKVVLLDFTVYGDAKISARNIELRELYDKYKAKGFEVYQISFDNDEHFWKNSADNLPWVCVHDEAGFSSYNAVLYRIEKIPTFFLVNRDNEVVLRDEQIDDLKKSIETLLKK